MMIGFYYILKTFTVPTKPEEAAQYVGGVVYFRDPPEPGPNEVLHAYEYPDLSMFIPTVWPPLYSTPKGISQGSSA